MEHESDGGDCCGDAGDVLDCTGEGPEPEGKSLHLDSNPHLWSQGGDRKDEIKLRRPSMTLQNITS